MMTHHFSWERRAVGQEGKELRIMSEGPLGGCTAIQPCSQLRVYRNDITQKIRSPEWKGLWALRTQKRYFLPFLHKREANYEDCKAVYRRPRSFLRSPAGALRKAPALHQTGCGWETDWIQLLGVLSSLLTDAFFFSWAEGRIQVLVHAIKSTLSLNSIPN